MVVVANSNFSPSCLTFSHTAPYSSFSEGDCPFSSFQTRGFYMNQPTFLFFLMLFLAVLGSLCWPHPGSAQTSLPTRLPCLPSRLHCLLGCRASASGCRVPGTRSKAGQKPASRVNTAGFACPNQQCSYFGITAAHIHAAFRRWQAWPRRAHPDVSRSRLPHHVHVPVATLPCTV
jgi:hypothetical protein